MYEVLAFNANGDALVHLLIDPSDRGVLLVAL